MKKIAQEILAMAKELTSSMSPKETFNAIFDGMDAAYDLVDGIDGMMSETGQFPRNYWKRDVLSRYDKLSSQLNKMSGSKVKVSVIESMAKEVRVLLEDLLDGLNGVVSEQGQIPKRYWKSGVDRNAKKHIRILKQV